MTRLLGIQVAHGISSETRVFASLLAHRDHRYEPLIYAQHHPGSDSAARIAELSASTVEPRDMGWRPNTTAKKRSAGRLLLAAGFLARIPLTVAAARRHRPDVVYSSQQHYDCRVATSVARALRVPQVIHLHYIIGPWLQQPVLKRLKTVDHVVAVSDFIRQQAIDFGVRPERVTTIRNSMLPRPATTADSRCAARSAWGPAELEAVFGMVGRLDDGKGHLDAISAFEQLQAARPNLAMRLVIVGTGIIESAIRDRAARSPSADSIVFTGQRNDVPELLGAFDALLHPATDDPCPLAVLEAMASGLPVVGYRSGGVPELVTEHTGLLVEHGDVGELGAALALIADDPDTASRLGDAGRRRVADELTPDAAGARFAELVSRFG